MPRISALHMLRSTITTVTAGSHCNCWGMLALVRSDPGSNPQMHGQKSDRPPKKFFFSFFGLGGALFNFTTS